MAKNEARDLWLILSQYYSPFSSRNSSFHNKEVISGYLINCRIPAQCQHHSSSSRHGKLDSPTNTIRAMKNWLQLQFQDFLTQMLHLNYHYFICRNTSPPWICISPFQTYFNSGKKKKDVFYISAWNVFFCFRSSTHTKKKTKTKPHCAL